MKRIAVVALSISALALVGFQRDEWDWQKPFQPTRLEWLALVAEAREGHRGDPDINWSYSAFPPNGILITLNVPSITTPGQRNHLRLLAEEGVERAVELQGWKREIGTLEIKTKIIESSPR